LTLATPVGVGPNEAWFCGQRIGAQQAFGLVAHSEFDLATRGDFDIVAISVNRDHLDAYSQRVDNMRFPGVLSNNQVLDGAGPANDQLRALLLATLATARDTPQLLAQDAARRAMTDALCDALMARFGRCPIAMPSASVAGAEVTAATRQRVVREARRYMQVHAEAPISVPDLCEALHVSRRTLQYSFQDVLQMSPVTYLRALRLNGVRRDLQRGGDEPVADHAARWGFWHQSRFAADYRQMFGELPSETLRLARSRCGIAVH
jgi:AraC family ethanolamine operon transcriptional activator